MTIIPSPAVQRLLEQQMARGQYASENEVLQEALQTLREKQEREETIRAVREGVAAAEAGETLSVEEAREELHRQFPNLRAN